MQTEWIQISDGEPNILYTNSSRFGKTSYVSGSNYGSGSFQENFVATEKNVVKRGRKSLKLLIIEL